MAVNDESFYNLLGEEISRNNLVQQMIDFYSLLLEVGETKITDFNEGSEIRNILEAFAVDVYILMESENELTEIGFVDTAYGEWLDKHGLNPFIGLERDVGMEATGYVTFSIPEVATTELIIPEGTIVVCEDNGLEFITDNETIISVGDDEANAAVTCLTVGSDGNCVAETVTIIDDEYLNIPGLSVVNEEAFSGGTDYEEDDEYRERLLAYIRKDDFGSIGHYEELGNNVDGVHDVVLVNATGYTKKVLVNGDVKPTPDDVLVEVASEFTNTFNIVVNHTFTVARPTYVTLDLSVALDVLVELDEDELKTAIADFFNGGSNIPSMDFDGLFIGEPLSKYKLYPCLESFEGVESVTVTIDNEELSEITCEDDEVFKLGTVTISQNVVS
ncbi:baseplate J/gp47 family protein [Methanobrevibacter sp.]|uniref:baseplate J/gp47 family protein n=1 Tax=Methanobrevibacter sp. TaxID=66852 RepID=UPI00388D6495